MSYLSMLNPKIGGGLGGIPQRNSRSNVSGASMNLSDVLAFRDNCNKNQLFDTPGNHIFTVPENVNLMYAVAIGGGGGGGGGYANNMHCGGGGGGAGCGVTIFIVEPGTNLDIQVGNGGISRGVYQGGSAPTSGQSSKITNDLNSIVLEAQGGIAGCDAYSYGLCSDNTNNLGKPGNGSVTLSYARIFGKDGKRGIYDTGTSGYSCGGGGAGGLDGIGQDGNKVIYNDLSSQLIAEGVDEDGNILGRGQGYGYGGSGGASYYPSSYGGLVQPGSGCVKLYWNE